MRFVMRATRFEKWGVRPITQRQLLELLAQVRRSEELQRRCEELERRCEELEQRCEELRGPPRLAEIVDLRRAIAAGEDTIAHLRRVTRRSEDSIQAFVDEVQRHLSGIAETTEASRTATRLITEDGAAREALAALLSGPEGPGRAAGVRAAPSHADPI